MKLKYLLSLLAVSFFSTTFIERDQGTDRHYGGFYSPERIANLRVNCNKYEWAGKQRELVIANAKPWIDKSDEELWQMVPGQDLPRAIDVTFDRLTTGPRILGCLVCGEKIFQYGNYPYDPDFENKPWKLTCPSCKSVFPTNDFYKYYKSAIDEHGLFDPAKGDRSLLFNTDHPDPDDPLHKSGVDDGYGYIDQNGRAHRYIGYYTWKYWTWLNDGLTALADAFIYTGNTLYAHKAAILLDRIADVYPDMDWKPYADRGWYHSDGGSMLGKIGGSIWETGVVQQLADSYDKILSGTINDTALYNFLRCQSEKYKLPGKKGTREYFIENVDIGILHTALKAVLSRQIRGNQGMHQMTVATCAMALNTEPYTTQWLDWLFEPDGGAIPGLMISRTDRDGTSDEGAPGYAFIWGRYMTELAYLLKDTIKYNKHNIFRDFPQFRSTYSAAYRMSALGMATPNLGDFGSTGLVKLHADPAFMARGYRLTRDPEIAVAAYRANGYSAEGLGRDIFSSDPGAISNEILQSGEKAGPRPVGGYLMSGFGLAILESGNSDSGFALVANYGRTKMHAHPDMLNFDIFAFGNWLAPDHGYPEFATRMPGNTEWTGSTLSHNLVFVNKQPQKEVWGGRTVFFKQLNGFGVFELDGQKAYPDTRLYSRTMFIIGTDNKNNTGNNSYIVDIFRVTGGDDHLYSFHGPPGTITTTGLTTRIQNKGTYAGEEVPKGAWAKDFPVGYSHLYNIRKDLNPAPNSTFDWKTESGYRGITEKDNIHLRLHTLSLSNDIAIADGDPPQNKAGNPKKLVYVLMHRSGEDLNSTFVNVFEPYRDKPFISSVKRIDKGNRSEIAIQIELTNGHVDYVLYNSESKNLMQLENGILMKGTSGFIREKNKEVLKGILVNGLLLKYKSMKIASEEAIRGKILKMNKELAGGGWMITDTELPADGSLIGEQIIVDTDNQRDACYTIRNVEQQNGLTLIDCGPISFVQDYKGGTMEVRKFAVPKTYKEGYIYDFEEGAQFRIILHKVWNKKGR